MYSAYTQLYGLTFYGASPLVAMKGSDASLLYFFTLGILYLMSPAYKL